MSARLGAGARPLGAAPAGSGLALRVARDAQASRQQATSPWSPWQSFAPAALQSVARGWHLGTRVGTLKPLQATSPFESPP